MGKKTVVFISDLHCGALSGLTPPDYRIRYNKEVERNQAAFWYWYEGTMDLIKPDILCVIGDAVDGRNRKSGGVGCITSDLFEQAAMATEAITAANAKKHYFIRGTDYHVAQDGTEIENLIARNFNATIENRLFLEIHGKQYDKDDERTHGMKKVFDLKHKVGSSTTPYGMFTPQAKEATWNLEWFMEGAAPVADYIIRGHVHRFSYAGTTRYLAINLPALQLPLYNAYGEKCCSGTVDVGMVLFEFDSDTAILNRWAPIIYGGHNFKAKVVEQVL